MVTAERCYWDPKVEKAKCIDCSCDPIQCDVPEICFKKQESHRPYLLGRNRYDGKVAPKKTRFEYQRQSFSHQNKYNKQKKGSPSIIKSLNFWDHQLEDYNLDNNLYDILYPNDPPVASTYDEPHVGELRSMEPSLIEPQPEEPSDEESPAVEPEAVEPPTEELGTVEPLTVKPELIRKLYFRKPYDSKRKPVRHLLRPEISDLHKLIFRDPIELREEILKNISIIHSLKKMEEADRRRLEDLLSLLMHLNNDEMV